MDSLAALLTMESLVAFLTLVGLEVVLGIDNIIFIAVLAGRLPAAERDRARTLGIQVAVVSRILLLLSISWVMRLTRPLFEIGDHLFTGKDLILVVGGAFLLMKATVEIHHKVEGVAEKAHTSSATTLKSVLIQVLMIDVVFSLDSVITAVGMTPHVPLMIAAVLASTVIMLIFSRAVVDFVEKHPAVKLLALSFLMMIGVLLVAEGFGKQIGKGYIYFAMAFSLLVELLQMRMQAKERSLRPFRTDNLPPT
jgi:predicted tellurium resistance membrane protein TerC